MSVRAAVCPQMAEMASQVTPDPALNRLKDMVWIPGGTS